VTVTLMRLLLFLRSVSPFDPVALAVLSIVVGAEGAVTTIVTFFSAPAANAPRLQVRLSVAPPSGLEAAHTFPSLVVAVT
jgi:hypothetical protein